MFILIYDPYQNLNTDSMVWVFNTKDEAVNEMREQFFDLVIEETDVEVDDGHIYTYSPLDERGNWIDEWQAFLGEGAWVIHEVPGTFVPERATKTCPECGTELFEDMSVCYSCLHEF